MIYIFNIKLSRQFDFYIPYAFDNSFYIVSSPLFNTFYLSILNGIYRLFIYEPFSGRNLYGIHKSRIYGYFLCGEATCINEIDGHGYKNEINMYRHHDNEFSIQITVWIFCPIFRGNIRMCNNKWCDVYIEQALYN